MKGVNSKRYKRHFPNFTSGRKNVRILTFYNIFFKFVNCYSKINMMYDVSKFQVLPMKITEENHVFKFVHVEVERVRKF